MPTKPAASKPKAEPVKVNVATPTVDEKALMRTAEQFQSHITALTITDQDGYNKAALERASVKQHIDYLEGIFGPAKKALNAAVLSLRNEEKKVIGPRLSFVNGLLLTLNTKMSNWIIAEERRVAEEKRKADESERKRVEAEKAKLLKQANKAEDKGKDAKAETLRTQAAEVAFVPAPVKQAVSFSGTGTTARDDISVSMVDPRIFLRYLLDSGADVFSMIEWKYGAVKSYVKGLEIPEGETIQKAPGIKVEKKKIIAG